MHRSRNGYLAYALVLLAVLAIANPAIAADGSKPLKWPTTGRVTQPYGCTGFSWEPRYGSCRHFHGGVDIANSRGTPVRAAAAGIITHVGRDPWGTGAWLVMLKHGNGLTTWYAHMRPKHLPRIRKGVRVSQGDLVGYMDRTGMATGVHLHWAVLKNGRYVNPRHYIDGQPQRPRRSGSGAGGLACADLSASVLSGGATAVALEADSFSGGRDSCFA